MTVKSKGAGPVQVKADEYIVTEGESGSEMYILEEGKVEILKRSGDQQRRLGVLEQGDFFGEMAILEDLPRGASARAMTDCKLLRIDHSTFDQMLRQYPEIAVRMLRKLSSRLREASTDPEARRPAPAPAAPTTPAETEKPPARSFPFGAQKPPAAPKEYSAKGSAKPSPPAPGKPVSAKPAPQTEPAGGAGKLVAHPSGTEFPLPPHSDIKLGRFDSVTGIRPDIDLTAVDTNKLTSRRHAKILRQDGKVFLFEEIGTPNGTFVNGERIRTGVRVELKDGDEILFADVKTIYRGG